MKIVNITDKGEQLSMDMDRLFPSSNKEVKQDGKQYYAKFTYWNGDIKVFEIKKEHVQDILDAVTGQYTFVNNMTGLTIHGETIQHVDIAIL